MEIFKQLITSHNWGLFERKHDKRRVLRRANETHRLTVVAVVVVVGVEVRVVEVHVPRVVAIVVRSRPVVAVGTDIVDRSPVPVASSRKKDLCTLRRLSFTTRQKNRPAEPMTRLFLSSLKGAVAYELFLCHSSIIIRAWRQFVVSDPPRNSCIPWVTFAQWDSSISQTAPLTSDGNHHHQCYQLSDHFLENLF